MNQKTITMSVIITESQLAQLEDEAADYGVGLEKYCTTKLLKPFSFTDFSEWATEDDDGLV